MTRNERLILLLDLLAVYGPITLFDVGYLWGLAERAEITEDAIEAHLAAAGRPSDVAHVLLRRAAHALDVHDVEAHWPGARTLSLVELFAKADAAKVATKDADRREDLDTWLRVAKIVLTNAADPREGA